MFIFDFVAETILDQILDWIYGKIIGFLNDFFVMMNNMGVELFELPWVNAVTTFFSYLGWVLFGVGLTTDIPLDSNARTKDVGATMVITGKILAALDGDITDSTRKLALWSVVSAEKADVNWKIKFQSIWGLGKLEFKNSFYVFLVK